jgi:hypothetical protein
MRKLFGRKSEPELPLAINDFSSEHSRASHDTKLSKSSRVQAKLGLRAIESTYNDSFDAEFSMIAIHGSGGDVDISWTNRESGWCWIRDIWDYLPIQTWTFGYDSKSKLTPAEHADWLLDAIIQQNLYRGPIIFLAKDFGGLILSQVWTLPKPIKSKASVNNFPGALPSKYKVQTQLQRSTGEDCWRAILQHTAQRKRGLPEDVVCFAPCPEHATKALGTFGQRK